MTKDLKDRVFWTATDSEIREARTTDVYFEYAVKVLERKGLNPEVVMEVYARSLPYPGLWGVVTGIYEVAKLLEGLPVNVRAMEEGEVFLVSPESVAYEPVLQIEGHYRDFALYENPVLGFLCYSTGISTRAARIRVVAGNRILLSFGTRRTHPALAPTVERAAYIAGFDSASNILGAELLSEKPVGTMPHSLVQCFGDQKSAWLAFDEVMPAAVPRVALVDTFYDEKTEAIMALEALGEKLQGIRIDTPTSRRGNWRKLIEEVKWELKTRGADKVKIFVSGGIDEEEVAGLRDIVDGFGVGTSVSSAPMIDFSAKIVELRAGGMSLLRAKRGDIAGRKQVYRARQALDDVVTLAANPPPEARDPLLSDLLVDGKIVRPFKTVKELRRRTSDTLRLLDVGEPRLAWT